MIKTSCWLLRMLEDGEGNPSTMRMATLLIVVFGLLHAFFYPDKCMFSFTMVSAAIGLKYGQARIER